MMNYKEYNDSLINDANEKSKSKRKLLKSSKRNGDVKSSELERQKEEFEKEEARKQFIQQNMNKFVNGSSAFDWIKVENIYWRLFELYLKHLYIGKKSAKIQNKNAKSFIIRT